MEKWRGRAHRSTSSLPALASFIPPSQKKKNTTSRRLLQLAAAALNTTPAGCRSASVFASLSASFPKHSMQASLSSRTGTSATRGLATGTQSAARPGGRASILPRASVAGAGGASPKRELVER